MLSLVNWSWVFGLFGMFIAFMIYQWVAKQPNGTELMQKIEGYIRTGAMAFLKRQYTTLAVFVVIVFILLTIGINWQTAVCFVTGALCSMFAGFFGMMASTKGNSRTAWAANQEGMGKALIVSYLSGSVMGLAVGSLGRPGRGDLVLGLRRGRQHGQLHQRVCHGRQLHRALCSYGRRHLHQGRGCGIRPGRERWKPGFLRMTPGTRASSRISWVTTWATSQAWAQTSSSPTWELSSRPSPLGPPCP